MRGGVATRRAIARAEPSPEPRADPRVVELAQLEARLAGAPHEILGVAPRASVTAACAAFADLAARYHPDRFGHAPELDGRVRRAYRRLRTALAAFVQDRPPPRRPGPLPPRRPRRPHQTPRGPRR